MGPAVIPIACRFVHCDQWLVTHFDPTWKIVQVKLWILAKCMPTHAKDIDAPRYRPASPITFAPDPQDRPISPITFAPPAYAKGPFEGTFGYGVDDELDDPFYDSSSLLDYNTATRQRHQRRNPSLSIRTNQPPQPEQSPPPDTQFSSQFTLIRFSTGQILEDDFTLEWYSLAPYELIEIHRNGMILRLPRASVPEYAAPYFEAKVLALRVVGTDYRSGEGKGKGKSTAIHDSHMRKRKAQLQWAERWLVIREGVFKLCKDCSDTSSYKSFPLSSLNALRGSEHIAKIATLTPTQRIICSKFMLAHDSTASALTTKTPSPSVNTDLQQSRLRRPMSSANLSTTSYLGRKSKPPPLPTTLKHKGSISTRSRFALGGLPLTALSPFPSPMTDYAHMAPVDEDPDDRRSSVDSRQAVRGQSSKPALYDSGEESEDATQLGHEGMCVRQEHVSEDGDYDNLSREKGQAMHVKSEKGQWIVLDLMDDHAYTNLLRILHRSAAHPIRSAFIPALPALTTPTPTPTPLHSPSSASYHPSRRSSIGTPQSTSPLIVPSLTIQPAFGAHPYPEWRIGVVRRALRAGLGEVGKAMSYLMWGDLYSDKLNGEKGFNPIGQTSRGRDADSTDTERESHTKDLSSDDSNSFSSRASPAPSDDPSGRCDIEYSSEEETSEAEWEGWMGDLVRQASVSEAKKKQKGGEAHFGSDYEDHRYNSRLQHWFAQREFQEERRAFEPTGVVVSDSSAVGNYSSLHASALTHTPSESYSSMTRVLDAGRSLQSTSYSQSSPKSTLTSAYGFNFSPNKDDPLSSATSPSKTNESDSPSQLLHNSASSAYRSPKRFTDGSESNCSSMRRAASSSNLVSIASTEPVSVNSSSGMGRFLGAVTGPSRNASGAIDRAGGSILPATAKLKKKDKRSGKGKDRRGSEARGAERDGDSSIEEQEKLSEGWNKQQRSKLSLAFSSPDGSSQHTQTQPRSSVLRHVGSQSSISEKG